MPITESDYDAFIEKIDPILSRYPSLLSDKDRFLDLFHDPNFASENTPLYYEISRCYAFSEKNQHNIEPVELEQLIERNKAVCLQMENTPYPSLFS